MGSGEGCHLLCLGDCLGAGVGETAAVGCSSTGEVLCSETSGGNRGVSPSRMWYEAVRVLLSNGWTAITRQPDKWRESHYGSCSPLPWLVPLGLECICHIPPWHEA